MSSRRGFWLSLFVIGSIMPGCALQGSNKITGDGGAGVRLGSSVAVHGTYGLVGAPGSGESGSVYVYSLDDGNKLGQQILPETATEADDFGLALALDGDVLVIGAPLHEHDGYISGAAFAYRQSTSGTWTEEAILVADLPADLDYFGTSISASEGNIAIGSPGDDLGGSNAGAVYVFGNPDLGWALDAKLTAPDSGPGDRCGTSTDMAGDRVLVGCPHGFGSAVLTGAAYLFRKAGSSYVLEQEFSPTSEESGQLFGSSVSISEGRVFVGAPGATKEQPGGAVYVFELGDSNWQESAVLSHDDQIASLGFGAAVAVDGRSLVVGAQRREGDHLAPGSAFLFGLTEGSWQLQATLTGDDIDRADGFGSSVAIAGEHILVGAAGDSDSGSNAGAAYYFSVDD